MDLLVSTAISVASASTFLTTVLHARHSNGGTSYAGYGKVSKSFDLLNLRPVVQILMLPLLQIGFPRRTRVIELQQWGEKVTTWHRYEGRKERIDENTLYEEGEKKQ